MLSKANLMWAKESSGLHCFSVGIVRTWMTRPRQWRLVVKKASANKSLFQIWPPTLPQNILISSPQPLPARSYSYARNCISLDPELKRKRQRGHSGFKIAYQRRIYCSKHTLRSPIFFLTIGNVSFLDLLKKCTDITCSSSNHFDHSALPSRGLLARVLSYRCNFDTNIYTIQCSHLAVDLRLLSSVHRRGFANSGFRIRKKALLGLHSKRLLRLHDANFDGLQNAT